MTANFSFVEAQACDAVLAHYGLSKTADIPRFEDAVKLVSPLRRAGAGFLSGALPGAAVGGIAGALSADNPEDRMRRALIGAAAGTAVGGSLNAARHYVGQRDINALARDSYDRLMKHHHGHIQDFQNKMREDPSSSAFFQSMVDESQNAMRELPSRLQNMVNPKRTYLERLFKKQSSHYGLAKSSFVIGPNAASTARRVSALPLGILGGVVGTGVGAVRGAYNAPKGEGFSGAIKGGLKGGAIGTAAGAGLGALRGHTMRPADQDAIHQAMINIRDFHR